MLTVGGERAAPSRATFEDSSRDGIAQQMAQAGY